MSRSISSSFVIVICVIQESRDWVKIDFPITVKSANCPLR